MSNQILPPIWGGYMVQKRVLKKRSYGKKGRKGRLAYLNEETCREKGQKLSNTVSGYNQSLVPFSLTQGLTIHLFNKQ